MAEKGESGYRSAGRDSYKCVQYLVSDRENCRCGKTGAVYLDIWRGGVKAAASPYQYLRDK